MSVARTARRHRLRPDADRHAARGRVAAVSPASQSQLHVARNAARGRDMIWRNPWAWLGLTTLALPVLIHLLGRGHARVQPFPSLRFLERSKFLPTRRTRLHDVALLLVRLAILAVAVAALAQPFLRASRARTTTTALARAILVDTSASMRRASNGGTALEAARRNAQRLVADARPALIIESSSPAR